jgi:hypothetical protein
VHAFAQLLLYKLKPIAQWRQVVPLEQAMQLAIVEMQAGWQVLPPVELSTK